MGQFHLVCIQRRALAALVCVAQSTNAAVLGICGAKTNHLGVLDPCIPNIPSMCIHCLHTHLVQDTHRLCLQAATTVGCAGISLKHGCSGDYFPRQQKALEYRVWLKNLTSEQLTEKSNIKAMDVLKVEIVVPPSEVVQCGSLTQQPGWEEISDNLFCVGTEVPSSAKVPSEDKEVSFTFPSSTFHPYEGCFK